MSLCSCWCEKPQRENIGSPNGPWDCSPLLSETPGSQQVQLSQPQIMCCLHYFAGSFALMYLGLHLYSAFIQSALQCMPFIHPFTHTHIHSHTHQRRLAAMQGTNQLVRSNWGLGVSLRDTSTRPGWDRTGNPPTARRQLYLLSHIAPINVLYLSMLLC